MIIQLTVDEVIGDEFKDLARANGVSHKVLFQFLWMEFLRSSTPQIRAAKLNALEKK